MKSLKIILTSIHNPTNLYDRVKVWGLLPDLLGKGTGEELFKDEIEQG